MIEGTIDLFEGKFGSAIKYLYKFHQIEPGNPFYRYWYAKALAYNQNIEEALKIFEIIERDTPNTIWSQLSVFFTNALKGKKTEALRSVTKEAKEMLKKDEMFPVWMAESYALIHEKEEALDWLEHGINWGFVNYTFLNNYDRFLDNIRGEPRFKKLMKRVKHEWENFEV
jgi:tetratricopeptide (TPR) repeat protein